MIARFRESNKRKAWNVTDFKNNFGTWLIRKGTQLRGFNENYGKSIAIETNPAVGETCSACRNCGSPTQTTDRLCWRCVDACPKDLRYI